MKRFLLLINVVVLVAAFWGIYHCSVSHEEKLSSLLVSDTTASLLANKILLEQIRERKYSNALELLELSVDSGIMILTGLKSRVDSETRTNAEFALKVVREYRDKYPRKTEAIIGGE